MKISTLYEEILTEIVNQNLNVIIDSINNKKLINIYYDDDNTGLKGWRRVEPFCVGVNKYGNECLRAWQEHGHSASYPPGKDGDPLTHMPGWRMFRLDKITNINTAGNDRFSSPRPKYNPKDSDMSKIYAAADFGNNNTGGYTTYNNPQTPVPTVTSTSPSPSQSFNFNKDNGYATYDSKSSPEAKPQEPEKKSSTFNKWADRFKNLIGYKPK